MNKRDFIPTKLTTDLVRLISDRSKGRMTIFVKLSDVKTNENPYGFKFMTIECYEYGIDGIRERVESGSTLFDTSRDMENYLRGVLTVFTLRNRRNNAKESE